LSGFRAEDLAVVIPTRDRWPMLDRCLRALAEQQPAGFETVVVVDGEDQEQAVTAAGVTVLRSPRAGPGVARNLGVERTGRPLVLLLGDDILAEPGLIAVHLAAHNRRPAPTEAVLGRIAWHPEAAAGRIQSWLEWSATQFDFGALDRQASAGSDEAGWARFYSSNVSLKASLFRSVGGFDPDFRFLYEDIDLGWRLSQAGMVLRYQPAAVGLHVHRYDWPDLRRRFETAARAERVMVAKHPWFRPHFADRARSAITSSTSSLWSYLADVPLAPVRSVARPRADAWYYQQLAPFFLNAWDAEDDLDDLRRYLGDDYDPAALTSHDHRLHEEAGAAADEADFYRTSRAYLYDLTAFAMWPTKIPYRRDVMRVLPAGARLLDYGCGTGTDGLRLLARGYRVDFADYDNPSTRFLRWRLADRGIEASVFDIEGEVPGGFDLAFSFDVAEHVPDPFELLRALEERAALVAVNLLEEDGHSHGHDGSEPLHHSLPVRRLLDHATSAGLVRYRLYHGRSHFVIYRSPRAAGPRPRWRSVTERMVGRAASLPLPGRPPLSPGGRIWR